MSEVNNTAALAETLIKNIGADLREFKDGDYRDEVDGLWHCGVCKKPMQKVLHLPFQGFENRVVRCQCLCEKAQYEEELKQERLRKDREAVERLRDMSLMDEKFRDSTFDRFKLTQDNTRQFKLCRRYATAFDEMMGKNQGLLFWGKPGTGKTYSAACIANYLLDNRQPVVMTSFVKLIAELQKQQFDEESIIGNLNRAALLIIDDLGAERSTDYALERVYNIVDSRYRAKKPMLLTTNLSLAEMQSTTDIRYARIYDRVFEVCYPVEFTGQSWRYAEAARRYDEMQELLEG